MYEHLYGFIPKHLILQAFLHLVNNCVDANNMQHNNNNKTMSIYLVTFPKRLIALTMIYTFKKTWIVIEL
jgi:hypothetical protein